MYICIYVHVYTSYHCVTGLALSVSLHAPFLTSVSLSLLNLFITKMPDPNPKK